VKIANTLDPMLGAEKFRAGVSIDCDFSSAEESEETFDPTKSVMVTSQTSEDGAAVATASGVPGTASNLPRPTSRPSTGSGGSSRHTENVTYASSRLVKHTKLPQGMVRRISISVLLDYGLRFEKGKKIIEPPSPDRVKVVHDLVAAVAGVVPDRGDQVIVESSPFESTLSAEPEPLAPVSGPGGGGQQRFRELMADKKFRIIAGIGCGLLIALLAGAGVLVARRNKHKRAGVAVPSAIEGAREGDKSLAGSSEETKPLPSPQGEDLLSALSLPQIPTRKTETLVKHLQRETKKDPVAAAQVIRSWLTASE
jgi:flagellar M-ring protein FliF